MQFFQIILAGAFAATAFAQGKLAFTKAPSNIQAGQTYTLKWEGGDSTSPVTILLREGPSNNLHTVDTLTTTGTGGSFDWTVPTTIADTSDYAFQIIQGTQSNYWGPIAIAGGSGTFTATGSASASASRASSAASVSASASASSSSASESSSSASASSSSASAASSSSAASSRSSTSSTASQTSSSASSAAAPSDTGNAAMNIKGNAAFALGAAAAIAYIA